MTAFVVDCLGGAREVQWNVFIIFHCNKILTMTATLALLCLLLEAPTEMRDKVLADYGSPTFMQAVSQM